MTSKSMMKRLEVQKQRPMELILLVDHSGSMRSIKRPMEQAIHDLIKGQDNNEVFVSLYKFNHNFNTVYEGLSSKNVPYYTIEPNGDTALFDSIVTVIRKVNAKDNPDGHRVLIGIITDGHENASKVWTTSYLVKNEIEAAKFRGFNFVFLGSNQDAILSAEKLGIYRGQTLTYANNAAGTAAAGQSLGVYTTNLYKGVAANFTEDDRNKQTKLGA